MRIAEMKSIAEGYHLKLHQEQGWHLIAVDDSESLVLDIHVFAPGRYSAEQFHQVCRLAQQLFYPEGSKYFD